MNKLGENIKQDIWDYIFNRVKLNSIANINIIKPYERNAMIVLWIDIEYLLCEQILFKTISIFYE